MTLKCHSTIANRRACLVAAVVLIAGNGSAWAQEHASIMSLDLTTGDVRSVIHLEDYPSVGSPDVSPDGKKIAFDGWKQDEGTSDAQLILFDLETGEYEVLGHGAMPTWSPDGKYLAHSSYSPRGVFVRSLDGKQSKQIGDGWGIQWSPDGTKLAYTESGAFVIYDLLQDEKRTVRPGEPDDAFSYIYWNSTWSPDSKQLAFKGRSRSNRNYQVAIVDISADPPQTTICFAADNYDNDLSWHPHENRLFISKRGMNGVLPQLHQFEPQAGAVTVPVPGQPQDRKNVGGSISPDGKTFYFVSRK